MKSTLPKYNSFTMILPVYNEAARIKRVINYYKNFAPLIVVDNYSDDGTTEILKQLSVSYVLHKNPGTQETPEDYRYFNNLSPSEYFLLLSCSEFIPGTLLEVFDEVAKKNAYDMATCVVDAYTSGELIPLWGGSYGVFDRRISRFFKKGSIAFDKVVIHGKTEVINGAKVLNLPREKSYTIIHLRDSDAFSLIKKHLEYANVEAHQMVNRRQKYPFFRLMFLFIKEIFRFLQCPPAKWKRIAVREIWARMVMHTITYWIVWELKSKNTISESRAGNENLWQKLIRG